MCESVKERGRQRKFRSHDRRRRLFADAAHGSGLYGVPYFTSNTRHPLAFSPRCAPLPPSPRRRLHDVLSRFSSNGASARYRSNPRRWIRSRSRVYGLLTLFLSRFRFRSPALSHPRLSQLHPDPGCIGIPTQRSDRSAPVVLPPSAGFPGDFRRAAVTALFVATLLFRAVESGIPT